MTRAERLGLEPHALGTSLDSGQDPFATEVQHSIAISLKRIADSLERQEKGEGFPA